MVKTVQVASKNATWKWQEWYMRWQLRYLSYTQLTRWSSRRRLSSPISQTGWALNNSFCLSTINLVFYSHVPRHRFQSIHRAQLIEAWLVPQQLHRHPFQENSVDLSLDSYKQNTVEPVLITSLQRRCEWFLSLKSVMIWYSMLDLCSKLPVITV